MKQIPRHSVLTVGISIAAIACSPEPSRTVSWYQSHPEERKAALAACQDDPGGRGQTPNCINAGQAEGRESFGSFQDVAPFDLPPPKKSAPKADRSDSADQP